MKTYILKELSNEVFPDVMAYLDDIETSQEEGQIYINSGGGSVWVLYCIRDRLEELRKKGIKIKLRAIFICSCAFDLFYHYKGEKVIERDCDAIVHTMAHSLNVFQIEGKIRVRSNDEVEKQRFNNKNTFDYEFLTKKEDEKFNNGDDVYLDYKRLQSIFE